MASQTIATIDLGTNSVHLLIASQTDQHPLTILHDEPRVVRLGEGLRQTGEISHAALTRTIAALLDFKALAQKHACTHIYLTATAALREASNQTQVIESITHQTGLQIELVDKTLEGQLSFESIVQGYPPLEKTMVIDIGGGSVDFGWGIGNTFTDSLSISIGTVKLLEGPLAKKDWTDARKEINLAFAPLANLPICDAYIGTAGTFTQMAAVDQALTTYTPQAIDNHRLTQNSVNHWLNAVKDLSLDQIKAIPGVAESRADVLVAGTLLIQQLFYALDTTSFTIRDRGVRFGRLYRALSKPHFPLVFAQNTLKP